MQLKFIGMYKQCYRVYQKLLEWQGKQTRNGGGSTRIKCHLTYHIKYSFTFIRKLAKGSFTINFLKMVCHGIIKNIRLSSFSYIMGNNDVP
jgi:hypothetical protein